MYLVLLLVFLECSAECFNDTHMEELPHHGECTVLRSHLLVGAVFPGSHTAPQLLYMDGQISDKAPKHGQQKIDFIYEYFHRGYLPDYQRQFFS